MHLLQLSWRQGFNVSEQRCESDVYLLMQGVSPHPHACRSALMPSWTRLAFDGLEVSTSSRSKGLTHAMDLLQVHSWTQLARKCVLTESPLLDGVCGSGKQQGEGGCLVQQAGV